MDREYETRWQEWDGQEKKKSTDAILAFHPDFPQSNWLFK